MLHTTKNLFFMLSVSFVISVTQTSFADEIPPPPLNAVPLPVGSGARALGQGGAFIAVADDATAASWNPGGMVQLERSELSVVGSFLSTQQDFDPGSTGFSLGNESVSRGDLNYASVVYPFRVFEKNLVAALNYQQIYDFHMQLDFKTGDMVDVDFESKGGVGALTPAISMRVTPKLSVGVAVNVFTDEFFGDYAWKAVVKNTEVDGDNAFGRYIYKNFQAVNVTTGLLWHVWEKEERRLTFGAVYDTPYTADVDLEYDFGSNIGSPFHQRGHFEIDYPMSFGVGLAFRSSDALSFSADATWTDWSEFEQKDEEGNRTRPLGYVTSADRDIDDTYAVRCGTEYLIFKQKFIIPVRGGLFYEPRPSLGDPTDVYGFSVGSGITFKRFSLDGAYQFRWANDVDGEDFGLNGTHFDLTEHMFLASMIVYF
ncbi:MAG: outer membrane protein transport protein [Candidatus Brocadia sp.]|nr:outer membrane protein transport protein [Candidatus Brocadia sp.]